MLLSKARLQVLEILKQQGFIENFLVDRSKHRMRVFLKYRARKPVIQGLKRVSKPSLRKYVSWTNIPKVLNGIGIAILSTSQGVMDGEQARRKKVGGEVWCFVW